MLASLVLAIPLATPTTFQATPAAGRPAAPRAPTRVRVLDARHGLPLGGARLVWFDTADLDPRRAERAAERHSTRRLMWRTADEDAVTTGADGLAELPGPRGTLYVRAELHDASAWFSHAADDERPAEVALDVTPTVPVRLLDAEGAPIAGARAWWLAAGSAGGPLPVPAPDAAPSDDNGLARVGVHAPAGTERFRLVVDGLDLPSEVLGDGGGLPDDLWLYDSLDWATRVRRASDGAWAGLVFPTRSAWLTDGEGTLEETLVRFVEGEAGGGNDGAADGPLRVVLDREALDDLHGRLPFERAALAPAASDRSPRAGDDRR